MKGLAVILAVVFVLCALLSIAHPLPSNAVTDALGFSTAKAHVKHPVFYFVLALLSLIWLRFQTAAPAR